MEGEGKHKGAYLPYNQLVEHTLAADQNLFLMYLVRGSQGYNLHL